MKKILKAIKLRFKQKYEVKAEGYYSKFLKAEDAKLLKTFVKDLSHELGSRYTILAVGSSTFPKKYFDEIKKMNKKSQNLEIRESYRDIDLIIIPNEIQQRLFLLKCVKEALNRLGLSHEFHEDTWCGVSYGKQSGTIFAHISYGLYSISTELKNRTNVDIILGRDDLLEETAEEKIKSERYHKNSFSLLHEGTFKGRN